MGLQSISKDLVESYCCIGKLFLKTNSLNVSLSQLRKIIEFRSLGEEESNERSRKDNAVLEFEIFLASLEKKKDGIKKFLKFVTGCDRIPLTGFDKNIEVHVLDDCNFPNVSTCSLLMRIPTTVTQYQLQIAIEETVGFAIILLRNVS